MRKLTLSTLSVIVGITAFAQVDPVANFNRHVIGYWAGEYIRISQYQVKGSPYLLGESFPGTITFKDGKVIRDQKIFFNLYEGKAGIDLNNKLFEADTPVQTFSLILPEKYGGDTLEFINTSLLAQTNITGFANILSDGKKAALLKLYKVRLSPDPSNTMASERKVFEQYYEFVILNKKTNDLKKIKLREKEIVKALDDDAEIKKFLEQKKLNLTNETDVIFLLNYYNLIESDGK